MALYKVLLGKGACVYVRCVCVCGLVGRQSRVAVYNNHYVITLSEHSCFSSQPKTNRIYTINVGQIVTRWRNNVIVVCLHLYEQTECLQT